MTFKENISDKKITIKEVINIFHKTNRPIVFIIHKNKLLASITDGDIRRAILNDISLDSLAFKIGNKNPKFLNLTNKKVLDKKLQKTFIDLDIKYVPIFKNGIIQDIIDIKTLTGSTKNSEDVIIMAGGKGKRLMPLTKKIPKPLLKINKKPLIKNIIYYLNSFGFNNFKITLNHFSNKIIKEFKSHDFKDSNIEFIKEKKPLGTVGALSLIKNISKNIIIINSDLLTLANVDEMLSVHKKNNSDITIGCITNYQKIDFGVINFKNKTFDKIEEKPIKKYFHCAGIYIIKRNIKNLIPKNKKVDMPNFINSLKHKKINIFPIYEKWIDIGSLENLADAKKNYINLIY